MSSVAMAGPGDAEAIELRVRSTGLLAPGRPVLVLLSGGRDSVCLLDLAARIVGAHAVRALHVNYGLRASAEADTTHCRTLCARLGVALSVHRPDGPPAGNVQAWARAERYAAAERLAASEDALVAVGHTASDQVETVLYRLAASPGRRALLGMRVRDGRRVRPLLDLTRAETAAYCRARGLAWREDPTNADPRFARARVRHDLLPTLRELHRAAEANVLATLAALRDEAAVLDHAVDAALVTAGDPPSLAELGVLPAALGRLVLQRLADSAAAAPGPPVGRRLDELVALGLSGGSATVDLGGGLRARVEYGRLRVEAGTGAPTDEPGPAASGALPVPGRLAWAGGELVCERGTTLPVADGTFDLERLCPPLEVRARRPGDRMRPLGLGGSRRLQDLLVDRKVPRALRDRLPVVLSGGEVAWVPGVATGEAFRVTEATRERARITWEPAGAEPDRRTP